MPVQPALPDQPAPPPTPTPGPTPRRERSSWGSRGPITRNKSALGELAAGELAVGELAVGGSGGGAGAAAAGGRGRLRAEVWIVLGLSLGQSGVYALVRLYSRLTAEVPLADQTATLNPSRSPRPYLDLTYQLLGIGFALVPVALALYLLSAHGRSAVRRLGLDGGRIGRDLGIGVGLAALIGLPGIGFYLLGRALGLNVQINPAGLNSFWWTIPVLVLAAVQNALLEEVVAVGYLMERLAELRWTAPTIIAASALLRGSYHLYQGPGMAAGNVIMGVVFSTYYLRRRRVLPLVVAHTVLDVVSFVGYAIAPEEWLQAVGLA